MPKKNRKKGNKSDAAMALRPILLTLIILAVAVGVFLSASGLGRLFSLGGLKAPSWVDVQIVDVNGVGRRGEKLEGIRDIVIHYVGNPGTTAQQNRNYYNNPETTVSSHFVIGLDGEVIQCIPLDEKSSASNDRNLDTISIEVCHPDASGQFTTASYDSLVRLTAWLCDETGIGRNHVIRHYDVTGKACPLYFVDHPDAWDQFLDDVKHAKV